MAKYRSDDISLLIPEFRALVEALLVEMRTDGFAPVLRDGLRTRGEAAANAAKGVGIADSMHLYGIAADIICDEHGWGCAKVGCHFFTALGEHAKALGLTWGGDWRRRDLPHVQMVPVGWQTRIRRAGSPEAVGAVCRQWLARGRR